MGGVVWGFFAMRVWTEETYSNTAAQGEWQEFRDAISDSNAGGGPVQRRVPASEQPPGLVLLRDYFLQCLTISIVLTSALFATFAFMIRGIALEGDPIDDDAAKDLIAE